MSEIKEIDTVSSNYSDIPVSNFKAAPPPPPPHTHTHTPTICDPSREKGTLLELLDEKGTKQTQADTVR